ncbi:MAG: cell division protein FtsA [FCB group bacterium]|nr:cell division protein FtsA [FCB group bacterium]
MGNRGEFVGVVDFGSRDIRVLIARRVDDGAIEIIGHGTAPGRGCVSQGVIQDLNAAQNALRHALTQAEKEARVRVLSFFCGVNGKNVETFVCEGIVALEHGTVEEGHLEEAREVASREIVAAGKKINSAVTAQEWYVDGLRVIDPIGIHGQELKTRVHFARLPAVIEDNIASCVESQHREVEDILFQPLAASLGCLTPEDMELGVAVLDMGRNTTGLAVYRDYGILGTHCFDWGGYHITRDVAAGLQVSFEEADQLILEYGISDAYVRAMASEDGYVPRYEDESPADNRTTRIKLTSAVRGAPSVVNRQDLDFIISERARELLTKVRQYVNARGLMKNLVRGVVLTGGASTIRNHVALAESVFEVPSRVGLPSGVEIIPHEVNAPEWCTAIGLVHHAFDYRSAARNARGDLRAAAKLRSIGRFVKRYFF